MERHRAAGMQCRSQRGADKGGAGTASNASVPQHINTLLASGLVRAGGPPLAAWHWCLPAPGANHTTGGPPLQKGQGRCVRSARTCPHHHQYHGEQLVHTAEPRREVPGR
ncbi:hypothetical protein BD626DRAFT_475599 [Schizophyllum amplum]|uniref:Uncharacterized protein n=1 Tax=Schizophyllum amplum TaxID=97359 RepID=A0A550CYK1_9AGAR|nr:hypothetical protein BD626DRAFT_475599 [Auriculariopsis ampla]